MAKDLTFRRYKSTIMMCDVRGFTHSFDKVPPGETYLFVTSMIGRMEKVVQSHQGRIVNLAGDGFLAQFGFEQEDLLPFHEINIVQCASQLREELTVINKERHSLGEFAFSLGIGINTGLVASGELEVSGKLTYLVLGDSVNTASRIENLCKFFSVDVLISDTTFEALEGKIELMKMPLKELRGKAGKFQTYWLSPTYSFVKEVME